MQLVNRTASTRRNRKVTVLQKTEESLNACVESRVRLGHLSFCQSFFIFLCLLWSGCVPYLEPSLGDQQEKLERAHATHPLVAVTASPFLGSQQQPNQLCTPTNVLLVEVHTFSTTDSSLVELYELYLDLNPFFLFCR